MITFFSEFQQPKCPEGRSCFHHRNGPVDNAGVMPPRYGDFRIGLGGEINGMLGLGNGGGGFDRNPEHDGHSGGDAT